MHFAMVRNFKYQAKKVSWTEWLLSGNYQVANETAEISDLDILVFLSSVLFCKTFYGHGLFSFENHLLCCL